MTPAKSPNGNGQARLAWKVAAIVFGAVIVASATFGGKVMSNGEGVALNRQSIVHVRESTERIEGKVDAGFAKLEQQIGELCKELKRRNNG